MSDQARTVTRLLRDWQRGDQGARDALLPMIYGELDQLAARHMRGERNDHTMRPSDLVNEAYLRLAEAGGPEWSDRLHFFAIAARTMRQILVDYARKRCAEKRGAGERPVTFDEKLLAGERPEELVALDDALAALAKFDERKARIVELHYFGGMTQDEVAKTLEVHVNTVARDLRLAEAWLHKQLREAS